MGVPMEPAVASSLTNMIAKKHNISNGRRLTAWLILIT
jgi:hypothetical protein